MVVNAGVVVRFLQMNITKIEKIMIKRARPEDAHTLTRLSFASKAYWQYPQAYFEIWEKELTISPDYIQKNDVYVYDTNDGILGYYSMVHLSDDIEVAGIAISKGYWLEHMFVAPGNIGNGIGTELFNHMKKQCIVKDIRTVGILADPNARGFYERMGCAYMGEYPSTIEARTTPFLQYTASDHPEMKGIA